MEEGDINYSPLEFSDIVIDNYIFVGLFEPRGGEEQVRFVPLKIKSITPNTISKMKDVILEGISFKQCKVGLYGTDKVYDMIINQPPAIKFHCYIDYRGSYNVLFKRDVPSYEE
jgi:hypothetical protein